MADRLRADHGLECQCLLTDRPGGATEMAPPWPGPGGRAGICLRRRRHGPRGGERSGRLPNAAMTCVPAGTGNDFLKNFGADMSHTPMRKISGTGEFSLDLID